MRQKNDWKGCPVRYAAGLLGDPWTLVLLRDLLFRGKRHFREFLAEEKPATDVLAIGWLIWSRQKSSPGVATRKEAIR